MAAAPGRGWLLALQNAGIVQQVGRTLHELLSQLTPQQQHPCPFPVHACGMRSVAWWILP